MASNKIGGSLEQKLCGCGNLTTLKGLDEQGRKRYKSRCYHCSRYGKRQKADSCQRCGFIPEDMVQLDVDHIDGNPSNNDSLNLQTLCANCHRLKTKQNNDWNSHEKMHTVLS